MAIALPFNFNPKATEVKESVSTFTVATGEHGFVVPAIIRPEDLEVDSVVAYQQNYHESNPAGSNPTHTVPGDGLWDYMFFTSGTISAATLDSENGAVSQTLTFTAMDVPLFPAFGGDTISITAGAGTGMFKGYKRDSGSAQGFWVPEGTVLDGSFTLYRFDNT